MANGPGVSISEVGDGKWRVRWREVVEVGGQRERKQRERYCTSHAAAIDLQAKILRKIEAGEVFEDQVRVIPAVASFDAAAKAWLQHKDARGVSEGTREKYRKNIGMFFGTVRELRGIPTTSAVPVDILSRELFAEVILAWRGRGLSDSTVYNAARCALDAWTWAADDAARYPGLPQAPRDKSTVLPQPPIYVAPPAPKLTEVDAVIRRLTVYAYVAKGAAVVMRYTGLRISQVLALELADLDTERMTLTVRLGKSRREKATIRTIPVSAAFLEDVRPFLGSAESGTLIRRRRDVRAGPNRNHHPTAALTDAWQAATDAGECRLEVWRPANREVGRPDHAFRAALQDHLQGAGVRAEVVDALVGHAGKTTRSSHYAGPDSLMQAMREAVDALPPIRWQAEPPPERQPVEMLRVV
jgi:integrase